MSAVRDLISAAGMTAAVLADPSRRSWAIDEFNARVGGVRAIIAGRSAAEITPIPTPIAPSCVDHAAFLERAACGRCVWMLFGAGRATRMKLPSAFDQLGIAGLTRRILRALARDVEGGQFQAPDPRMTEWIKRAADGTLENADDLSIVQRVLCQLRHQFEALAARASERTPPIDAILGNVVFVVVVNSSNRQTIACQLHRIRFGGLEAANVYLLEQPEVGGEEVLPDGSLRWYEGQRWPEGHGQPMIAAAQRPGGAYRLDRSGAMSPLGEPLVHALRAHGATHAVFAQVNDLHLMRDVVAVERWDTALEVMAARGSQMVMEMVANAVWETLSDGRRVRQKGGATFVDRTGFVTMRDTVALKTPDLEPYARPEDLSRMFYILELDGLGRLTEDALPAYLNERKTADGRVVLTREFYSGDASSSLRGLTMKQAGFALNTFKTRARIPAALEAMERQDHQPGFLALLR